MKYEERVRLFEEARRIRKETGFGSKKIGDMLGLKKSTVDSYLRPIRSPKNCWSKEEDKIVQKHYRTMQKDSLIALFDGNRSWSSIKTRASDLGIKRTMVSLEVERTKILDKTATDFEVGFIIGLIEGEGTISCWSSNPPKVIHPCPYISIYNNNVSLLKRAQDIIGGRLNLHSHKGKPVASGLKYVSQKNIYRLQLYGLRTVYETLKALKDYFICKKEVAELVYALCEERLKQAYHDPLSALEEDLVQKIRNANK